MQIENTDMKFVYDFHYEMQNQNLIVVYEGDFNQDITNTVLSMIKKNLEAEGENATIKKKIFNIMVECLQNLAKHAEHEPTLAQRSAIFMIGKVNNDYVITTGNTILENNIKELKEKIEFINSLNNAGLKELYKNVRLNKSLSKKGGAGLGLIDIARKSGNKIRYDFDLTGNNLAFFTFQAIISKN